MTAQRALAIEADATLAADEKVRRRRTRSCCSRSEGHDGETRRSWTDARRRGVRKDGVWRVVIGDSRPDGDANGAAATSQQVGDHGERDLVLRAGDGGDTVSLVTDAGSHGTHVAGRGGSRDDDPRNVAPGAGIRRLVTAALPGRDVDGPALIAAKRYGGPHCPYGDDSATSGPRRPSLWRARVGMAAFIFGNAGPALDGRCADASPRRSASAPPSHRSTPTSTRRCPTTPRASCRFEPRADSTAPAHLCAPRRHRTGAAAHLARKGAVP